MFSPSLLFISAMLTASATLSTVMAQSSSSTTTTAPVETITGTPTSTGSASLMTLECWVMTTIDNEPASIPVQPTDAVASKAECWEVFPNSGGATLSIPYTNTDPNFAPTADFSSSTAMSTAAADNLSTSSSNKAMKVLLPALLCSIVGTLLLVAFTLYYIRRRARKQSMSSRARQWAHRHSASWQLKDSAQKSAEDGVMTTNYAPTAGV